jgi:serine/threonine kinase 16
MIADDGVTPILMDFGSTTKARIHIENRSQALLQQVGPEDLWVVRFFF